MPASMQGLGHKEQCGGHQQPFPEESLHLLIPGFGIRFRSMKKHLLQPCCPDSAGPHCPAVLGIVVMP